MATQLQVRRGTTAQMNAFTGAEGEIAVNTSTDTVHVHDGATAGGFALAKADGSNIGTYAGSFTTISASGAITGNVTGNLTGSVLTAAQTNITSVGTLSTLAVSGALTVDTNTLVVDATNNRVGINTSPSYQLDLKQADTYAASFENPSDDSKLLLGEVSGDWRLAATYGSTGSFKPITFWTSDQKRLTIDTAGNVGIGNSSPSSYFSNARNLVVGGTTGANGMTISGSTDTQIFFADGTSGADAYRGIIRYSHADNGFSFWTNATRVLDISSTGNVGISTTDPKSSLEVKGTFGAPATSGSAAGFISRFSQSSGVGCLDFGFGDPYSWIQSRASNNYATNFDLTLQPNGGKVGIGTSSPRSILDLDGGSETQLRLQTTNTGSASSDGLLISLDSSANAQAYLWNYENAAMIFGTNATERLRIASNGSISIPNQNAINELTFTGTEFTNVVSATTSGFQFGTTGAGYLAFLTNNSERMRILPTGGITFNGDTAQANALDDYEEGAWTPTSGVGLSVTTAEYVKIGRLVHVNLDITFAVSTSGSEVYASLPFPSETTFAGGSISYQTTGITLIVNIQAAGIKWRTGITSADASYAQLSGKRVIMSATYLTTA